MELDCKGGAEQRKDSTRVKKHGEISKRDVKYLPTESESLNAEQEKHKQAAGPAEPAGGCVLLNNGGEWQQNVAKLWSKDNCQPTAVK